MIDPEASSPAALAAELTQTLARLHDAVGPDPASNPIFVLALELSRRLDRRDLDIAAIGDLVRHLTTDAFRGRAERLRGYLGETDPDRVLAALAELLSAQAEGLDFDRFRTLVERVQFGVVFTAHPTFAMPLDLARVLVELAMDRDRAGSPLDAAGRQARLDQVEAAEHRSPRDLTLAVEHAWSLEALQHAHVALDRVHGAVLAVARARYPDRWTELVPRLVSLATWVGYDQDGRSDITWMQSLGKRLTIKQAMLERQQAALAAIDLPALDPIRASVAAAVAAVAGQRELLVRAEEDAAGLPAFAAAMVAGRDVALVETAGLRDRLTAALGTAADDGTRSAILRVRSALATLGLGLGHIHFRLNASQIHNAVRGQIGMETGPEDPANRRSYFNEINDRLSRAAPATISFGTLAAESSSAKRFFMTVAQILKYVDGETPVRFLIAETESGFTLLAALYYARLLGIADRIEISPLFETAEALERGEQVLVEALRSPHFRDYLRQQGRLAIQFGFSDSGRFIGQMAATFRIERLRLRLAQLMEDQGLTGLELVLFNTHGESIGRGGHPGSLADRLRYVAPPVSRAEFARRGIAVREEVSFQGSDGYLPFFSPAAALASLGGIVAFALAPDPEADRDPIYRDADYAAEFFATVQQEFSGLVADRDYAALLGLFGSNLLYKTGSRPVQRQAAGEGWVAPAGLGHPSRLRAISNNAILQQFGLLANTITGVGRAAVRDPELFQAMREQSPRFRRAMQMVEAALAASEMDVLRAYVDCFDPGLWLARSGMTRSGVRAAELRSLAARFEKIALHPWLAKVTRRMQADYLLLRGMVAVEPSARRDRLLLLHALRIAVIHRIFLLAMRVPAFAPQRGVTRDELIDGILRLEITAAVDRLVEIFPLDRPVAVAAADFAEPASYRSDATQSYVQEHERIFQPLRELHDLARRIGSAISYTVGAMG